MHRTPSHTCSAVLPRLSPALQKRTLSEALCGRQAGRKTPNAVVLDEIAEHETTGQGETPGQVTALCEMAFQFWKGKAERNVT